MKLKRKVSLVIELTLTCLIAIVYFASHFLIMDRVRKQEEHVVWGNITRVRGALTEKLARLETIATDWAALDSAFGFIKDIAPRGGKAGFCLDVMARLQVNLVLIYDAENRLHLGKGLILEREAEVPVPEAFRSLAPAVEPLLARRTTPWPVSGIAVIGGKPMLVASYPIPKKTPEAPFRGTVVVGRWLDGQAVAELKKVTQLEVSFALVGGDGLPPDFREADRDLNLEAPNLVRPLSASVVSGYFLLTDLTGKPRLIGRVDMGRDLYSQGQRTVLYLVASLLVIGIIFIVLTIGMMEVLVISRTARLSQTVSAIGVSGDLAARVETTGSDELAMLGASINGMLEALERSGEALRESEEKFRELVDLLPLMVFESDERGEMTFANRRAFELLAYEVQDLEAGLSVYQIVVPEDRETLERQFRRILAGAELAGMECRALRKDGDAFPVTVYACRILSKDKPVGLRGVLVDLTARKRAEEALKRRDNILGAVSYAAETFLRTGMWLECLDDVLARLGKATEVDRVYIFENHRGRHGEWVTSQRREWVAADIPSVASLSEFQNHPYRPRLERWQELLSRGETLHGLVRVFPEGERQFLAARGIRSMAVVPIFVGEQWWGFIGFDECRREREWSGAELAALQAAAATIGAVIYRRRSEEELGRRQRQEVAIAARIQQALLLGQPPRDWPGLSVAVLTIPSQEVGGDFFDFIHQGSDCLDVVVGDVMGKGIPAALVGAATKSEILRVMAPLVLALSDRRHPEPEEIVSTLHDAITPKLISLESAVTMCYMRLDLKAKRATYVDCGHTKTLHYQHRRGRCQLLEGDNVPLGYMDNEQYRQRTVEFEDGDVFFFYSDGITEAKNGDGELFGERRLEELMVEGADLSPQNLVAKVRQAATSFAQADSFIDDFTCVAIRVGDGTMEQALFHAELETASDLSELGRIQAFVRQFCLRAPIGELDETQVTQLQLAVNETATNIMRHAYEERPEEMIWFEAEAYENRLVFRTRDRGRVFDPDSVELPPFDGTEEGGFGLFIVREVFDEVDYSQGLDGSNNWVLTKYL